MDVACGIVDLYIFLATILTVILKCKHQHNISILENTSGLLPSCTLLQLSASLL